MHSPSRSRRIRRAIALASVGACLAGAVAASSQAPAATSATTRVTVGMVEYRFRLSVKTVHTGTVIFTVINKGQAPHIFEASVSS